MATNKDKTEPSETTMSLGDHLEELRARLIKALLGLLVGAVICLCFGTEIVRFIKDPYIDAMKSHQLKLLTDPNALQQSTLFGILFSDLIETLRYGSQCAAPGSKRGCRTLKALQPRFLLGMGILVPGDAGELDSEDFSVACSGVCGWFFGGGHKCRKQTRLQRF